jgi:hypothetical protein
MYQRKDSQKQNDGCGEDDGCELARVSLRGLAH